MGWMVKKEKRAVKDWVDNIVLLIDYSGSLLGFTQKEEEE